MELSVPHFYMCWNCILVVTFYTLNLRKQNNFDGWNLKSLTFLYKHWRKSIFFFLFIYFSFLLIFFSFFFQYCLFPYRLTNIIHCASMLRHWRDVKIDLASARVSKVIICSNDSVQMQFEDITINRVNV